MDIKAKEGQSGRSKALVHVSILLAIAFCIGIYLIGTTALISKDGITFIEYAKDIETSPIEVIKSRYQHPGYPFLIVAVHKIVGIVYDGLPLWQWIYSAQITALIFRLLSAALLYFIGQRIVGVRFSFWAVLILILLPKPAELGSDALSDWPHLFFLAGGLLLLIYGAVSKKWWLFGFSGLAAGLGYLVRPECAQIVIFGILWLVLQMFWSQRTISRGKAVFALVLLMVGFLVAAGPYMKLKGAIFPKKQLVQLIPEAQFFGGYDNVTGVSYKSVYTSSFMPSDIVGALGKLVERVSETLMWFFVPALLIGIYEYFRKRRWCEPEGFFALALIVLNIAVMILLYCKFGYMSRRHTLPLVVFTIFYIPVGLDALACWLDKKFTGKADINFWFFVLLITGISICSPKLLRPIRIEKKGYREAARWLAENTDKNDIVAVSDVRIGFYAERKSVQYRGETIPREAQYAVQVFRDVEDVPSGELEREDVFSIECDGKKPKIVIYRRKD